MALPIAHYRSLRRDSARCASHPGISCQTTPEYRASRGYGSCVSQRDPPCLKDPKARSARPRVDLRTVCYNFARINSAVRMSPAMAARLTETLWDMGDIVKLIEAWEA